ncbi:hypothetical protein HPB47_025577 [Ixodes persulcatus]|uniref:Uncharacterized protein n=1 Tax=Ixodes persulcatus TaxID=34615 RepID=A0AC60Q306_IXOPE|nr:hypothetical protein HPB47_025577 [Ixodes persulcatus]
MSVNGNSDSSTPCGERGKREEQRRGVRRAPEAPWDDHRFLVRDVEEWHTPPLPIFPLLPRSRVSRRARARGAGTATLAVSSSRLPTLHRCPLCHLHRTRGTSRLYLGSGYGCVSDFCSGLVVALLSCPPSLCSVFNCPKDALPEEDSFLAVGCG